MNTKVLIIGVATLLSASAFAQQAVEDGAAAIRAGIKAARGAAVGADAAKGASAIGGAIKGSSLLDENSNTINHIANSPHFKAATCEAQSGLYQLAPGPDRDVIYHAADLGVIDDVCVGEFQGAGPNIMHQVAADINGFVVGSGNKKASELTDSDIENGEDRAIQQLAIARGSSDQDAAQIQQELDNVPGHTCVLPKRFGGHYLNDVVKSRYGLN